MDTWDAFAVMVVLFLAVFLGLSAGTESGKNRILREAFERGYAVQCLGVKGYYWECEE